jgi:hypothetical protein
MAAVFAFPGHRRPVAEISLSHPLFILGDMSDLTISCDECRMQHTSACDDCIVTFLCGREADDAVIIDVEEARALRLLTDAGLVPRLRHERRHG